MTNYEALLTGYPIHIATQEYQRRKHRKKTHKQEVAEKIRGC